MALEGGYIPLDLTDRCTLHYRSFCLRGKQVVTEVQLSIFRHPDMWCRCLCTEWLFIARELYAPTCATTATPDHLSDLTLANSQVCDRVSLLDSTGVVPAIVQAVPRGLCSATERQWPVWKGAFIPMWQDCQEWELGIHCRIQKPTDHSRTSPSKIKPAGNWHLTSCSWRWKGAWRLLHLAICVPGSCGVRWELPQDWITSDLWSAG